MYAGFRRGYPKTRKRIEAEVATMTSLDRIRAAWVSALERAKCQYRHSA